MLAEVVDDLLTRFRHEPLTLGATTIDPDVSQARVPTTDPRRLRPGETSRVVTVDVHTALIPIEGDHSLLSYWPPKVNAPEPSERNWHDPRIGSIRIPVYQEPGDTSGARTRGYLQEQDALIRKLVGATNAAIAQWNADLPAVIEELLTKRRFHAEARASARNNLGYPIATPAPHPVRYRLPRRATRKTRPKLEHGDYALLDDEDFLAVMKVVRSWSDYIPEHPAVVVDKNENALRDELLHNLDTYFESATGETFSKFGKTDIRVNIEIAASTGVSDTIFKAECKMWDDAGDVSDGFIQLTERYLTGRETRAALIMFVRDRRDFEHARERAVKRLVEHHRALLRDEEIAGWPVLDRPASSAARRDRTHRRRPHRRLPTSTCPRLGPRNGGVTAATGSVYEIHLRGRHAQRHTGRHAPGPDPVRAVRTASATAPDQ